MFPFDRGENFMFDILEHFMFDILEHPLEKYYVIVIKLYIQHSGKCRSERGSVHARLDHRVRCR